MDIFTDTQETIPESSQDLFNDHAERNDDRIASILKLLEKVAQDVTEIKRSLGSGNSRAKRSVFTMENATFKKRFSLYLRRSFAGYPWLRVKSESFKKEVNDCLTQEGYENDASAHKTMVSYGLNKFTDLRNQFRRKILADLEQVPTKPLNELCFSLYQGYCSTEDLICTEERKRATLIIRHFLHRKRYFQHQDTAGTSSFWTDLKALWEEIDADNRSDKYDRLAELDQRRVERAQTAKETPRNTEE